MTYAIFLTALGAVGLVLLIVWLTLRAQRRGRGDSLPSDGGSLGGGPSGSGGGPAQTPKTRGPVASAVPVPHHTRLRAVGGEGGQAAVAEESDG